MDSPLLIRQPLTAILSNAQAALCLLAQKSPDPEEIRDALHEIVHEDNRAGEVTDRLRRLLKKGERKLESVDINDLVRSTAALLHSELISREISVRLDLENGLFATTGDSVQLQQVLLKSCDERNGCNGVDPGGLAAIYFNLEWKAGPSR